MRKEQYKEIKEEELKAFKEKTKDESTLHLIDNLLNNLKLRDKNPLYLMLDYNRIVELIKHEQKRNEIKKDKFISKKSCVYVFEVRLNSKRRNIEVKNNHLLSDLSSEIQSAFDHEPLHLYEFRLKDFRFGPECDEWQEIFDSLDNIRMDTVINSIKLNVGEMGEFIYDFGKNLKHKIKLLEIKEVKNEDN